MLQTLTYKRKNQKFYNGKRKSFHFASPWTLALVFILVFLMLFAGLTLKLMLYEIG